MDPKHDQLVFASALILRERREHLGMSQSALAKLSGLHRSYISDLERGGRNLSIKNVSRLADVCGNLKVGHFLGNGSRNGGRLTASKRSRFSL